jgi:hypothetical protein
MNTSILSWIGRGKSILDGQTVVYSSRSIIFFELLNGVECNEKVSFWLVNKKQINAGKYFPQKASKYTEFKSLTWTFFMLKYTMLNK